MSEPAGIRPSLVLERPGVQPLSRHPIQIRRFPDPPFLAQPQRGDFLQQASHDPPLRNADQNHAPEIMRPIPRDFQFLLLRAPRKVPSNLQPHRAKSGPTDFHLTPKSNSFQAPKKQSLASGESPVKGDKARISQLHRQRANIQIQHQPVPLSDLSMHLAVARVRVRASELNLHPGVVRNCERDLVRGLPQTPEI